MKIEFQAIRYGPNAWLIHFSRQADENAWLISRFLVAHIEENPLPFLVEWTLSPTALLLEFLPGRAPLQAPTFPQEFHSSAVKERSVITIPVEYNGPDLDRVAECAKCSIREVIELHSGATYIVHALGFSPGFAYLGGLPEILYTPRLETPRTCIPAGSVGIGGPQTGIYPLATSGGWNLIGTTSVPLFDPTKPLEQAFLLRPGDRVKFQIHDSNRAISYS